MPFKKNVKFEYKNNKIKKNVKKTKFMKKSKKIRFLPFKKTEI